MDEKFLKEFQNPSGKWRGKPFWSWNGELEKDEILRQVHIIKERWVGAAIICTAVPVFRPNISEKSGLI
ncbi:MAG: hypothetical protein KBS41_01280 [Oscillospiraceae bacterium]|nr:hypothetical protein [Candidatus Equicaccousia limihippi]